MGTTELIAKAQTYFPKLQIKYKDQSTFMKIIGKLMFFNPTFMTHFVTTIGDTVYLPNEDYLKNNTEAFCDVFIHECTHMYDEKRLGFPYNVLYAFPQMLFLPMFLLLFVLSWKLVVPLALLMLAPLPAPFRAYFEKRAYFVQMYAGYKLYNVDPAESGLRYTTWFKDGSYYFMWPIEQDTAWQQEALNIKAGKPSCASEPALLQQVNDLIDAAKQ